MTRSDASCRIAVIGGTGPQGRGLGYRFARHGHRVVLGSRAADKAVVVAADVTERLSEIDGAGGVTGAANADACTEADVVLLAIPHHGHNELVASLPLAGKVVVSCVNPLGFDEAGPYGLVVDGGEGSAAEAAQRIAPDAAVVGAFHHVSAVTLWGDDDYLTAEDVLVCGDIAEANQVVVELARCVTGRAGIDVGRLRLARQLEPLTAVLISINKKYRTHSGVQISGVHPSRDR